MKRYSFCIVVVFSLSVIVAAESMAATIDMEGIAPSGGRTPVTRTTINDFTLSFKTGSSGVLFDKDEPSIGAVQADSGSDYLAYPYGYTSVTAPYFSIVQYGSGGSILLPFSIQSFLASDRTIGSYGTSIWVQGMDATTRTWEHYERFITDDVFGFETFTFDSSWTNLHKVQVSSQLWNVCYDNIVVNEPVPEPTTMLLFGAGLVGLVGLGRKMISKEQPHRF